MVITISLDALRYTVAADSYTSNFTATALIITLLWSLHYFSTKRNMLPNRI